MYHGIDTDAMTLLNWALIFVPGLIGAIAWLWRRQHKMSIKRSADVGFYSFMIMAIALLASGLMLLVFPLAHGLTLPDHNTVVALDDYLADNGFELVDVADGFRGNQQFTVKLNNCTIEAQYERPDGQFQTFATSVRIRQEEDGRVVRQRTELDEPLPFSNPGDILGDFPECSAA